MVFLAECFTHLLNGHPNLVSIVYRDLDVYYLVIAIPLSEHVSLRQRHSEGVNDARPQLRLVRSDVVRLDL